MNKEEYTKIYLNGLKHIQLAKKLGTDKDYGTAITFFILGIEELIKYLVIPDWLADRQRFTDKEINSLFTSHAAKHEVIIEFLESTKLDFGEKNLQSIFYKMTNISLTDELIAVQKNRFREIGTIVGLTEQHLTSNETEAFIQWVKRKANTLKNRGLYVDRENQSVHLSKANLISPDSIGEQDYNLVLKFTESFLKQVTFSKDLDFTDEEFIDMLNSEGGA